jgi:ATP-dependent exoDNAse (exonuclease V) alpha subunit
MRELKAEQAIAFEEIRNFIENGTSMHLLTGAAGTGKTYTLGEVVTYCIMKHISVIVTAPTHKAVKVLRQLIDQKVTYSTIHSALGMREYINNDGTLSFKANPAAGYPAENYKLIIVDEASMLDDTIFEELVNLSDRGKKILFVGDPYQIPPVNHIHAMPFIKSHQQRCGIGVSTLNEIIRQAQDSPVILYATSIRADIHKPVQIFKRGEAKTDLGGVFILPRVELNVFMNDILPLFSSKEYQSDIDFIKVIGWRNITVDTYNKLIRQYIFGENLPKIIVRDRLILDAPVIEDRKVLISTNDECEVLGTTVETEELSELYKLQYYKVRIKVFNKDIFNEYMIRIIHESSEIDFEKILSMQRTLAKSYPVESFKAKSAWVDYYEFYNHWARVKYSYCISTHKSQGSTYHNAYVLAWDILMNHDVLERNRILYTAATRPSHNLYVEY